jgi:hypothetical protein
MDGNPFIVVVCQKLRGKRGVGGIYRNEKSISVRGNPVNELRRMR